MLLHHSQTDNLTAPTLPSVWHLMLLHHSQTNVCFWFFAWQSGILCFYIILKLNFLLKRFTLSLVSYAFTSFSNNSVFISIKSSVWYLMLLHHSQTDIKTCEALRTSGILCFYIILKQSSSRYIKPACLVSYAFTSFSNDLVRINLTAVVWYLMLLHHSQTISIVTFFDTSVWYLMLLHHSQTRSPFRCHPPLGLVSYAFTSFSNGSDLFTDLFSVWYLMLLHHSQTP